jgi:hypothetical protein
MNLAAAAGEDEDAPYPPAAASYTTRREQRGAQYKSCPHGQRVCTTCPFLLYFVMSHRMEISHHTTTSCCCDDWLSVLRDSALSFAMLAPALQLSGTRIKPIKQLWEKKMVGQHERKPPTFLSFLVLALMTPTIGNSLCFSINGNKAPLFPLTVL